MPAVFNGVLQLDAGSVTNQHVSNIAANAIDAGKLQHVYKPTTNFNQLIGDTPVDREVLLFTASAAGTIRGFKALLNNTGSSTNISIDLRKNGTSVLGSAINITNANSNRQTVVGSVSNATVAAGDVFTAAMTVTSSTGAQGPMAWLEIQENSAP